VSDSVNVKLPPDFGKDPINDALRVLMETPGLTRAQALIDSGRINASVAGAVRGFLHDKKIATAIPVPMLMSLQKRIAGQIIGLLKETWGIGRARFDPYKQHCRTCSCGAGEVSPRDKPMTPADLLATLTRRHTLGLAAEHRLARERRTLDRALSELRTGKDPLIVVAELKSLGLRVRTEEEA
jgi:hypothetical protein